VQDVVKVACVQAEPVAFDRAATIDKLEGLVAEVAREGARLALFPDQLVDRILHKSVHPYMCESYHRFFS
jgi:hypothetical protein